MSEAKEVEALAQVLFGLRYADYYWVEAKEPERDQYRAYAKAVMSAGWQRAE